MSVAGTYDVVTKTPMGDQKGVFVVEVDGDGFSGNVSNPMMGSMDITGGQVDGNRLIWKMNMKSPMPISLDCEAAVEGDAINGTVKAGAFGSFALSGTRRA
ncbi:MAG: hypothetical protein M0R03_13240 [Novosphingobium sp.]|nr:hypothetical protein [Novosphingobium sp.]